MKKESRGGVPADAQRFTGTLVRVISGKGFGFIQPDEGEIKSVFVHCADFRVDELGKGEFEELKAGTRVEFALFYADKGPRALDVVIVQTGQGQVLKETHRGQRSEQGEKRQAERDKQHSWKGQRAKRRAE